ncbi:MAG: LuxR C-terminal-related transcriptional regulator [Mycobacterium leprae]
MRDVVKPGRRDRGTNPRVPVGARLAERERRELRAVGFVPVEAKLRRPIGRDRFVLRAGLVDRLRASRDVPLVVVNAPAGYGKTTLLAQWEDVDERPFAWVTLDAADRDPALLITYVMLALHRVEPVDQGALKGVAGGDRMISTTVLPRLGRMLAQRQRPFVLVLDDAHLLATPQCLEVVTVIIDHLCTGSQLVLSTRRAPALPLGRLRTHRFLLTLSADDLTLSLPEGQALLRSAGVDLRRQDVATLLRRTEGWPAALYLAALALSNEEDKEGAVEAFAGDQRLVADYLRDELLSETSPELVEFLTRTSVLDRLCAPLCDHVLQRRGSGGLLWELERSNFLIVPLDHRCDWYRYHQLLASMLRGELHRREPELEVGLHQRAGEWHETHGNIDEAISHALAAGDPHWAARLVWRDVPACLTTGRRATLEHRLAQFTGEQLYAIPELAIAAAWCALQIGRPPNPWVEAAERAVHDDPSSGEAESVAGALAVTRAIMAAEGLRAMRDDAKLACDDLPPDSPWRPVACLLIGVADHLSGDRAGGRRRLEEALQLCTDLRMPSPQAICLAQLALMAVGEDDWRRADAQIAEAIGLVEQYELSEIATQASSYAVFSLVMAHQRKIEQAERYARHARRMIALTTHFAPWLEVQARVVLARTHFLLGDSAAARILLSEAQNLLRQTPDAPLLCERLEEGWRMVEMLALATCLGPSALTTAELRVLQYLPTYLSFEEIGKRLFVSRNTVKTHAISAYRKLGVSSRSEAVERAKLLGLIEG